MQSQGENFFTAKFKKSRVAIFSGERTPRLSETPDAIILVCREFTDFSLQKSPLSARVMALRFIPRGEENARKLTVTFFVDIDGLPGGKLTSKDPPLDANGAPAHDFQGRFAIRSVKNAILVATRDGPPLLEICKAGKNVLELDVQFPHDPLWVFAIGIGSFLTKVK
jgi:hypothetical protein